MLMPKRWLCLRQSYWEMGPSEPNLPVKVNESPESGSLVGKGPGQSEEWPEWTAFRPVVHHLN